MIGRYSHVIVISQVMSLVIDPGDSLSLPVIASNRIVPYAKVEEIRLTWRRPRGIMMNREDTSKNVEKSFVAIQSRPSNGV